MPGDSVDTDVLIVGAGPVGLFLANECARRGLRWRIVETRATQSEHSKALAIFPRTLEIFDMAGVVGSVPRGGQPGHVGRRHRARTHAGPHAVRARGEPLSVHRHGSAERDRDDCWSRSCGAGAEPSSTRRRSCRPIQQDGDVTRHAGTQGRAGRGSRARSSSAATARTARFGTCLNLPFEGAAYDDAFMLADVETNDALPADELQLCPSEFGPLAIFPMSATRRRIVATIDAARRATRRRSSWCGRILAQRAPAGIEARALHWSSYFRIHHRQVAQLRVGRIFIAGDAAHIHSPFGGQGMNTGLHDVWNLAWKLDLVLHGHGNEALLDSYSAERLPVIKQVIGRPTS